MNGKLRVLDLFSGIGGFSLGLERTGGFETVAFCEIEDYPRRVLKKHWPGVPIYEDVRDITADQLRADGIAADVITGGFPCQDISAAGLRAGINEETRSGLWSELHRLIGEIRPKYTIVENVTDLLSGPSEQRGGWFSRVLGDLASIGFDAEWHCIPASAVGRPFVGNRVWIIAAPQGQQGFYEPHIREAIRGTVLNDHFTWPAGPWDAPEAAVCRVDDGVPNRVDRSAALGNAVVPQIPELIGHAILKAETTKHMETA